MSADTMFLGGAAGLLIAIGIGLRPAPLVMVFAVLVAWGIEWAARRSVR